MRSLLHFLLLCAAAAVCACYESHESTESMEDVFVQPSRAHSFMSSQRGGVYNPPRGSGFNYYNFLRKPKSPSERRAETCEDFAPCRVLAHRFGSQQAYNRYFGAQRPAGLRRH